MTDRFLTAREVAEYLGLSAATIVDWAERGKLPGYRIGGTKGGRLRFRSSEIEQLVESWRFGAGPPTPRGPRIAATPPSIEGGSHAG